MKIVFSILSICGVVFFSFFAEANFYRYQDRDGREFFTNDIKQIPPEYQKTASVVQPDENRVTTGEHPSRKKSTTMVKEHKDRQGKGEEYWRKKASKLRQKLRDQQDEYHLVLKQLENQDQSGSNYVKKKSRTSLEKKKLKLEKDIAQTRRKLDVDLVEEARRADAYPGWIRE
ncbi:MAG: hypothetical protein WC539_09305 [Nitrospirota bacterium]